MQNMVCVWAEYNEAFGGLSRVSAALYWNSHINLYILAAMLYFDPSCYKAWCYYV